MPSILNSDDGVVSGTSGLKSTGGNDGITAFQQNGTERMRIDSSGNVGIGTSSPSQKLTSVGNIKIAGAQASNNAKLCMTRTDTSWSINNETNLRFYVGLGDTDSPGTQVVQISNGGTAQFYSTVSVGNVTPASSGAGITFPATQSASTDANTLDDYEEGTFDVTVTMGTSGTCTMESTYNKMRYTKIGQMVTIQGQVLVASVSSPVGEMRMSLPFSIGNSDEGSNLSGCVPRLYDVTKPASGIYPYVYALNGNNYMVMSWVTDNSATINHVPAAGDYFIINFSYFI